MFSISFDISSGSVKDNIINNLPYNTFVIMNNVRNTHLTEEKKSKGNYHYIFKSRYVDLLFVFSFNQGFLNQYFQMVPVRTLTIASFVTSVCLVSSHP